MEHGIKYWNLLWDQINLRQAIKFTVVYDKNN